MPSGFYKIPLINEMCRLKFQSKNEKDLFIGGVVAFSSHTQ